MTVRHRELAERLDALGLLRHLPDEVRAANIAAVAQGRHPWATEIAPDVQSFADGEDLAEGGVEAFLAGLAGPLEALGVTLHIETASAAETGTYAVSINGEAVFLYDEAS